MAYFPNGSSFAAWQDDYCTDCVNYRDNGSGSYGCAITDTHFLLAHKMHDKAGRRTAVSTTLDHFIPDDGAYAKCRMRLTREMMADDVRADQHQTDLERYLAAMAEAAQGTEARRAETVKHGSVHDGPVGLPMRPTPIGVTPNDQR